MTIPFMEISGKGLKKPSYLFGTFHLLCKEDILFGANLKQAMKNAEEVYFEMDLDDPANTLGGLFFLNMKNGKSLKDLYTAEEYEKLKKFFSDSLKMNIGIFAKMKPMMLEALLYPRMMSCKNPSGVEMELMGIAKKEKKEIKGFETIQFQSSVFDSIPYEVQAKALLKDIDSTDKYRLYFNKMLNIYKGQQTGQLIQLMADSSFSEGLDNDILLKNRNINWVNQLAGIFKTKNIFIGVGAAHLFGKDGLIVLLRQKGYKVKPVENIK
ncbi:MAG: TraB/GumN family protein [Ferruginibacter sp.]